jgi:hypothetical protein
MADADDRRHIYMTPVRAERADDFEAWLRQVLTPAARKSRPDTEARVQTLRATEESGGLVYFAFVAEGGDDAEWDIRPLLEEALGSAAAESETQAWDSMLRGDQVGGTFRTLEF